MVWQRMFKIIRRKQAKLQWLQNTSQMNEDNMDSARCETGRTFIIKEENIWKTKLMG
jgi:hypothetical protein